MSANFTPSWLNLEPKVLNKNLLQSPVQNDIEKVTPVKPISNKESTSKFLELCGLRPCYESKEYMEWCKENVQPYNDYIRKIYSKLNPPPDKNNVDYNLYKEKEYEEEENDDYYEDMIYMNNLLNEMEDEEYYYDDTYEEHYTSEDDGELSDEYDEDGYDYVNSKFNYL